jgi:hypothetical protein
MIRRHVRTVRRKRLEETLGERDAVGSALPGIACGALALVVALFGVELAQSISGGRSRIREASRAADAASVTSSSTRGGP